MSRGWSGDHPQRGMSQTNFGYMSESKLEFLKNPDMFWRDLQKYQGLFMATFVYFSSKIPLCALFCWPGVKFRQKKPENWLGFFFSKLKFIFILNFHLVVPLVSIPALISIKWLLPRWAIAFFQKCCYKWGPRKYLDLDVANLIIFISKKWRKVSPKITS